MQGPFFSIVIPFKDREELLSKLLNSIKSQTFHDYEVIFAVDAYSKLPFEKTKLIIEKNIENTLHKNINTQVVEIPKSENQGSSGRSRNYAIDASSGKWLLFLDSDDIFMPTKLIKMFNIISTFPEYDFFTHNFIQKNNVSGAEYKVKFTNDDVSFQNLLFLKIHFLPSASCVKRESFYDIGYFSERFKRGQDWDWYLRFLKAKAFQHYHMNSVLTVRLIDGQNSSDKNFSSNLSDKRRIFISNLDGVDINLKTIIRSSGFLLKLSYQILLYKFIIEPLRYIFKGQ